MNQIRFVGLCFLVLGMLFMPGMAWSKPDLSIVSITLDPPAPAAAKDFKVLVTVKNGTADRAGSTLSVCSFEMWAYIDGQKAGTECDSFGLAGNSTDVYTINIPASAVPTSGTKKLKVIVDATSKVDETNETNNEKEISVTFTTQGPDLVVNQIWTYPVPPITTESTTLYAEIQNKGSTAATSPFVVRFEVDGKSAGEVSVSSLASGSKQTVQIKTTQTLSGTKTIKVTVDPTQKIPELDENNNTLSLGVEWKDRLPDLVVESISISPNPPVAGSSVTITATIKNTGTASAGGISTPPVVRFFVDGKKIGDEPISFGLGVGNSNTESVTTTITTSGTHKITVTVDPDNAIQEISDQNNSKDLSVNWLAPLPDLHAFDLTVNPGSPIVGSSTTFTASIKNIGPSDATGSILVDFYLDNNKLGSQPMNGLKSGDVSYINYKYTVTSGAGPHTIKVVVNDAQNPKELGYTNNTISKTFTWGSVPYPDLVVSLISSLPVDPITGQSTQLIAVIKNQGSKNIGAGLPAFYVRFYVDGKQVGQDDGKYTGLSAGSTATFNINVTLTTAGPHKIKVEVDPTDKVVESDEKNNSTEQTILWKAPPQPDFTITKIETNPTTVATQRQTFLIATVTNQGKLAYNQSVFVRFWVDGQVITPDYELKTGLAIQQILYPSASYTPSKSGTLLVKAMIDPDNKIAESDENNNTLEFKMTVIDPATDKDGDGVPASHDCDDNDKNIYPAYQGKPASPEICNGKDDNCDGKIDEDFDKDGDGHSTCSSPPDCNDNDKTIHPGAPELCNNKDDNCDGNIDENLTRPCKTACGNGQEICQGGNWTTCDAPQPKAEVCNGIDDDCNGVPDDGKLCPDDKVCKEGACVPKPPCDPACQANESCVNGNCVPNDPCTNVQCSAEQECKEGKCVDRPKDETTHPVETTEEQTQPGPEPTTESNPTPDATGSESNTTSEPSFEPNNPDKSSSNTDSSTQLPDTGVSGGCTCQHTSFGSSWLFLLLALLGLARLSSKRMES